MDIQLEKKKGLKKKHIPYVAGGMLFLALVLWIIFGNHASSLKVDARSLSIGKVTHEQFNDFVRVNGQVQPITIIQLSPEEGGIVQERLVEEGTTVQKGQIIIRLSNSSLDLSILNSEAELAEKQNFLRNTQVTMEQEKLSIRQEKLQLDLEIKRKLRAFQQQEQLYKEELIAREEYLQAKEDYELAREKRTLVIERQKQDSLYRSVQVDQMEDNLANMRRNVLLIRERKENLNIKSPINGELGLLDVVLGQSISMGQKIGQINDLSDFKIEALVDEHYIDRVKQGLSATFDRQDAQYALRVRKVFPEVRDGKFRTEFIFEGTRPDNIRSGQTYYINLELGQPSDAILIPKGSFFQSTGGSWIFVLDPSGKKAYRRKIKIGRQNPQYYEVTEGLEAGEKVVVSSYESYKDNEILILE
ncbi:MAG: HlyD family efflux transporter periplasmic adaptor subunit [Parabacteroides sp.]|nr:HlyD family efflux transporter periplasmic adaptor subunit [Parabacteroides sp.]MBP8760379.1 HlyD family efflux transporter periplasmic adaptor subunit [Parabacteroides sp.]MBP9480203.1 HlyD family efflux transporter periplasmic adaptor subunit [Parabacteroides sp.]MBP9578608.1 HlyD family efflux transporter periplasmic adaptor subunit [Parabacteroides sp.]